MRVPVMLLSGGADAQVVLCPKRNGSETIEVAHG